MSKNWVWRKIGNQCANNKESVTGQDILSRLHLNSFQGSGVAMESEDEPLLLQTDWDLEEDEVQEEEEGDEDAGAQCDTSMPAEDDGVGGVWRVVGWVYTQPWMSGVVLGVGVLLPCMLSAYMFLYCSPLDIDLSYSAFEVRSHSSAQRFDALTIALKTQLGSWDRRRRDVDDYTSRALRDLLLDRLNKIGGSGTLLMGGAQNESKFSIALRNLLLDGEALHEEGISLNGLEEAQKRNSGQGGNHGDDKDEKDSERNSVVGAKEKEKGGNITKVGEDNETIKGKQDGEKGGSLVRLPRSIGGAPYYSYLQSQALWRMELVFLAQGEGDNNIFTPERLHTIHRVERLVMQHPQFRQFCWKPLEVLRDLPLGPSYCSPPSSLLTYLFPSERGGKIYYDGMGPDLADIRGALSLAITHPQFYWYVDESLTPDSLHSSLLRSEIHFGAPLPSFYSLQDRPEEQRRRFRNFVVKYADILSRQSTNQVKVLYGGTELFDDEVRRTFHSDMLLALISGGCIAALVYVLTSFSVFLTFFGLASIGLSCLTALFLYHVVFDIRYLGILNGVAAFVIIGIAVHDFGLFMALIVSCCWLWVCLLMPAALCVWNQCVVLQENACLKRCQSLPEISHNHIPLSDQDDDIALLSVETESGSCNLDTDAPLLSLAVETYPPMSGQAGTGLVSAGLQGVLQRWVAEPVVEKRRVVIVLYVAVLVVSAGFCCLLRPASRAPLLFRSDTNLQTLLQLRSNLSAQGISCHMCSGLFMEKPHSLRSSAHPCPSAPGAPPQQHPSSLSNPAWHSSAKPISTATQTGLLLTVYVSKLEVGAAVTLYRFSLNASAFSGPHSNFSTRMTVCVSHAAHPHLRWMITLRSCDPHYGWRTEKLYFAQLRHSPYPSRVCAAPPGCVISAGPDGPTQGAFYTPLPADSTQTTSSKTSGFNPCGSGSCGQPAVRPLVDTGAMVFVVFGILGVNRTHRKDNHVIGDMGSVIYDSNFDLFKEIGHLCQLCKAISANTRLVKPGGAQCLPSGNSLSKLLPLLHPECQSLPQPNLLPGQLSHGAVGMQGVICLVVAVMYWLGWEMGAVEAISLSILVGSSVDYCLHLVEGFLLAGEKGPGMHDHIADLSGLRQWRTLVAVDHVGVAIVSSAVTTVISTVPLFFCVIVPFAKFGQIVAINTAVSILFTVTVTAALLATMGPARFTRPPGAVLKACLAVLGTVTLGVALYWAGERMISFIFPPSSC
ncbi:hypothetical protein JZ751_001449 [Albula glossodonta]|uniref:DUF7023 domain-containing protein n=1 Tax=Albula glossodonta TaxID=121402 RepID=A0A8T2PTZ0_9TELE|nr:hypothetical protein JZ751_001449 [Albula glossodonta]